MYDFCTTSKIVHTTAKAPIKSRHTTYYKKNIDSKKKMKTDNENIAEHSNFHLKTEPDNDMVVVHIEPVKQQK